MSGCCGDGEEWKIPDFKVTLPVVAAVRRERALAPKKPKASLPIQNIVKDLRGKTLSARRETILKSLSASEPIGANELAVLLNMDFQIVRNDLWFLVRHRFCRSERRGRARLYFLRSASFNTLEPWE